MMLHKQVRMFCWMAFRLCSFCGARTHTQRMTIVKAKRHQSKANLDFKNKKESNIAVVHLI